ncbi:MAG TPA: hypothetical protein VF423_16485 [Actinomycetes bacterium]
MNRSLVTLVTGTAFALVPLLGQAAPASAHAHAAENAQHQQLLANGQLHATPVDGFTTVCDVNETNGSTSDPAAYGLETAHHGPDVGTPGKRQDGCYENEIDIRLAEADVNPGIR